MKSRHAVLWIFVVIMIVAAAYGVIIVRRGFSAKEEPSALETFVARTVRNLSLAASTGNVRNPLPATPENIDEGLEHFTDHCAFCHSNDGSGDSETGRNLYPKPPDLRQSETQRLTDGQIYGIIANGVRLTGMPASDHDADDNWRLVLFDTCQASLLPKRQKWSASGPPPNTMRNTTIMKATNPLVRNSSRFFGRIELSSVDRA